MLRVLSISTGNVGTEPVVLAAPLHLRVPVISHYALVIIKRENEKLNNEQKIVLDVYTSLLIYSFTSELTHVLGRREIAMLKKVRETFSSINFASSDNLNIADAPGDNCPNTSTDQMVKIENW